MRRIFGGALFVIAILWPGGSAYAGTLLEDARSSLEKWLETRQLISKTRSDWQSDKEIMEQTIALYERELKSIEEQLSKTSTNSTQIEKERLEAETLQKTSNDALNRAKEFAAGIEAQIKKLVPQLPAP